jgi:diacylglycerol kinase (ATP)
MEAPEARRYPLVILNPAANRGKMDRYREAVRRRVEREHAEYVETTRRGEAKELTRRAAEEGRPVVIVGGDGSIHEAVNGMLSAGSRVPLGVVAAGSGNDYAWNTLGLPHDPAAAIERAFTGQGIAVDVGLVNGEYFANSLSVGLDANIAVTAEQLKQLPFMSGSRLYYSAVLKQLLFGYHHCPWLTLQLDEGQHAGGQQAQRYVVLAVTIGPTYGAGFRICPRADYRDGLLDICTIRYAPLARALKLLPTVQKGEHADLPEAAFYTARLVSIQARQPVAVQMDGETGSASRFDVSIVPAALQVRV